MKRLIAVLVLHLAAVFPAAAGAQAIDTTRAGSAANEAAEDTLRIVRVAPVTVTALRRPFDLSRVPYSISVNGPDDVRLGRAGLAVDEAMRLIPGVQVDNRFNYALGERISVRGFGARSQFGIRGVKVLVDGIPATLPDGQSSLEHVELGSLGRVEVVRGPSSALYGNAAGGVILLETITPQELGTGQMLRVITGGDGLLRTQGIASHSGDRYALLASVSRMEYEGFREFSDARNVQLNASLSWTPGDGRDVVRVTAAAVDYRAHNPGALSTAMLEEDRRQVVPAHLSQQTGKEGVQGQVGLSWQRSLAPARLELSIFGVTREVLNPILPRIIDLRRTAGGARAALTGTLGRGRGAPGGWPGELRWAVGAEADVQRDARVNFTNVGGERGELVLDQDERVNSLAAFGQASWNLSESFALLAGARADRFAFSVRDALISDDNPDDSGGRSMIAVSPSFGFTWRPLRGREGAGAHTFFANYSASFETPTTSELANRPDGAGGFNPELRPQRAASIEAGLRGILFMGSYSISAYRSWVRDMLIPFEVPEVPGRQFFRNAGRALHQGVEAGVAVAPTHAVRLRASYALTNARFRQYVADSEDFAGNRVPGIAPHRVEAAARVMSGRSYVELEARHVARIPVSDQDDEFSPAYTVADVRGGFQDLSFGAVRISPFAGIMNVAATRYNASVTVNAFGGRYYEPAPLRTWWIGMEIWFGGGATSRHTFVRRYAGLTTHWLTGSRHRS